MVADPRTRFLLALEPLDGLTVDERRELVRRLTAELQGTRPPIQGRLFASDPQEEPPE